MEQSHSRFVKVYRAANSMEAHLLRGILEQHGVPVRLIGDGLSGGIGELPLDVVEVTVEVPPGFRDLAHELIGEYERSRREPSGDSGTWECAQCGEQCPDEFAACWNCTVPRPTA